MGKAGPAENRFIAPLAEDFVDWGPTSKDGLQLSIIGPTTVHLAEAPRSLNIRQMRSLDQVAQYFILANYLPAVRNVGRNVVDICRPLNNYSIDLFDKSGNQVVPTGSLTGDDNWTDNIPVIGRLQPGGTGIAGRSEFSYLFVRFPDLKPGQYKMIENVDVKIRAGARCVKTVLPSAPLDITVIP